MNFSQLQERVRREAQRRIKRGTLSVSLLAKLAGMSQGHVSNFLNGRRKIGMVHLDSIMLALHLEVEDLLRTRRGSATTLLHTQWGDAGRVPLVSAQVAMHDAQLRPSNIHKVIALPADSLSGLLVRCPHARRQWERFVAIQITAEEAHGMEPLIAPGSLVVIDRHYTSFQLHREGQPNLYAVITNWGDSARLAIRFAHSEQARVILTRFQSTLPPEVLSIPPDHTPSDLIIGRIALILNIT
jgi:transcriptional regulator with XRE-family HTH domain